MQVPVTNSAVFRSLMAGALLLGASACSRSDRAETGSDTTAAARFEDTAVARVTQDVPGTGQDRLAADTTAPIGADTGTQAATGATAPARMQSDAPRAATASPSRKPVSTPAPADSSAGYRAMEGDTAERPESDSARVTEDTGETSLNQADTTMVETAGAAATADTTAIDTAAAGGDGEMARDTAGRADQLAITGAAVEADAGDTTMNAGRVRPIEDSTETMGQVTTDTGVTAGIADSAGAAVGARGDDTTGNAGRVRPVEDSTELQGGNSRDSTAVAMSDTTMNAGRIRPIGDSTETSAVAIPDSVQAAGDAAIAARGDDTTGNAGRVRPPEDSTEMQGNASSAESSGVNAADTADEAPVGPEARESDTIDRETEVASEPRTDAVGAAAIGGTVTGADAAALMTRQGEQCSVVDPESDQEVRWDMSSTPATLNPCGLGSMNLSKVWTVGQRGE